MEYHCTNILPKSTSVTELKQFLSLIGYTKYSERPLRFFFFKRDHYKYHTGVDIEIERGKRSIEVETWTYLTSNSYDRDYQIITVRQLRARFGGNFETMAGINRFPSVHLPTRLGAESGCYIAFSRFQTNLGRLKVFLSTREVSNFPPPENARRPRDHHPLILSNNLVVPFLVAALEDFFRSSFVALLQYSGARSTMFSRVRLTPDDLLDISSDARTVEAAFARHLSFQNLSRICGHFKELDKGLDLRKILNKRVKKSRQSMFDSLKSLIEHRHELIHRSRLDPDYFNKNVQRDMLCVQETVSSIYEFFLDYFKWQSPE